MSDFRGPLIILSPPRSLSSVISQALGQHPQLHALAENALLIAPDMAGWRSRYVGHPHYWPGTIRSVAELVYGSLDETALRRAELTVRQATDPSELFASLERVAAPRILIDKSPLVMPVAGDLPRIADRRPHARYLHIVRHPYTSIRSMMRLASWQVADMRAMAPLMWWSAHRSAEKFAASMPQGTVRRVRAEDVAADPVGELGPVLQSWGLRADAEALTGLLSPQSSPHASRPDLGGNAPDFLASPEWRAVEPPPADLVPSEAVSSPALDRVIAEMAATFGYETPPRRPA